MNVAVLGLGWVGLSTAASARSRGDDVVGYDVSTDRVNELRKGQMPFSEPGLQEALIGVRFSPSVSSALRDAQVTYICVGTPEGPDGHADLTFLDSAVDLVREHARPGSIVVIRSTVPVGTGDRVALQLPDHAVVSNPEFLREGSALRDSLFPSRIVIGIGPERVHKSALEITTSLVADQHLRMGSKPVLTMSRSSAEMVKLASNAFLATRVSFINAIARICDGLGADVEDVRRGVGLDERIGTGFLAPGLGYGGSCLPKDVASLQAQYPTSLLDAVSFENGITMDRAVITVRHLVPPLVPEIPTARKTRVAILGMSFKPGADDLRCSRPLEFALRIADMGYEVVTHDPVADASEILPSVRNVDEACTGADLVIVATAWDEYRDLPWEQVADSMRTPRLYDPWNFIGPEIAAKAGLAYTGTGGHGR